MSRRGIAPEHWTWRDGAVEPGRAVLIDIDGVLSDAVTRQHYIEAPRRDWRGFFEACGDDPVIEEVRGKHNHAMLVLVFLQSCGLR